MAKRWNKTEEKFYRKELIWLYVNQNKTIAETANYLALSEKTVFDRLKRLGIPTNPKGKTRYCNRNGTVIIPIARSKKLAEFYGVMLGDGHISRFQVVVTLGTKELNYVEYVVSLIAELFKVKPAIFIRKDGYRDIYLGSVDLVRYLQTDGFVTNKVKGQVDIPRWIFKRPEWMAAFIRGFFDTDGSVYRLRFGKQISFTNKSLRLLISLHKMLIALGYNPSAISTDRIYLTRKGDLNRFFTEIKPANTKHCRRYQHFISVGTQVVNEDAL